MAPIGATEFTCDSIKRDVQTGFARQVAPKL